MNSVLSKKLDKKSEAQEIDTENATTQGFGVSASPFNGVKLELGVSLLLATLLWLAADSITSSTVEQLLMFLGFGLISASWLIFRIRTVLRQCESSPSVDT